jgi:ubiquinone/menaquinone biosynthesis C-methylase UbiE
VRLDRTSQALDSRCYKRGAALDPHQANRLKMVRRLLSGCQGRALDYGCGYGDIAHAISRQFSEIIGVDLSPERVEWARREFSPIFFQVCSANSVDFADGTFQTVISIVVINWVSDPDLYLREIRRVLAPGGKLVLAVQAPDRLRNLVRASLGRHPAEVGFWNESVQQMTLRLQRQGFHIEAVDCFYDPLRESLGSLKKFISGMALIPMRICGACSFAPYYGVRAVRTHELSSV